MVLPQAEELEARPIPNRAKLWHGWPHGLKKAVEEQEELSGV
jgi:hypothetical protein